jgi:hypothetical protein
MLNNSHVVPPKLIHSRMPIGGGHSAQSRESLAWRATDDDIGMHRDVAQSLNGIDVDIVVEVDVVRLCCGPVDLNCINRAEPCLPESLSKSSCS